MARHCGCVYATEESAILECTYHQGVRRDLTDALLKLASGVLVTGVQLHNIGNASIVSVEVDGKWVELIRESGSGAHSHICEPAGIRARMAGTEAVKA